MPTIHNTTDLRAPPGEVFDLMADCERYPEWVAIVEEARLVDGEQIEEGAEYEEESLLGPKRTTSRWRVTEFDPPHRQVHRGRLPFGPVELTIETRPDGEGGDDTRPHRRNHCVSTGPTGRLATGAPGTRSDLRERHGRQPGGVRRTRRN